MEKNYIPVLKYSFLTRYFDIFSKIALPETRYKQYLIKHSNISKGHRVLDFGCGTGTLLIILNELKNSYGSNNVELHGVDIDNDVLAIAKKKMQKQGLEHITLKNYDGERLPYSDNSFDVVLSSLVFHHLSPDGKINALEEIKRVLKKDAILGLLDLGKQYNWYSKHVTGITIKFNIEPISENVQGKIPILLKDNKFSVLTEKENLNTFYGALTVTVSRNIK